MKTILAIIVVMTFSGFLPNGDLATVYKKGEIRLVPDAGFGAGTVWDMHFKSSTDKRLAFLPDGSFFKPAASDGKIYRFDERGVKVAEFGRKGQGPGDLSDPILLDIMDDQSLIVYESGNRRLSRFGLDGRFIKVEKIDNPEISPTASVSALAALSGGKIAVVAEDKTSTFWIKKYHVLIKDLTTGEEKVIAAFSDEKPQSPIFIKTEWFDGAVYLARAGKDKLLVAYSKSPEISFYSFNGEKVASFNIDVERIPIEFDHLEYVLKPDPKNKEEMEGYQKVIVSNRDKIRLPEFHPFYLGLGVDPDGCIILVLDNLARKTKDIVWRVYTPEGKPLATVRINPGEYGLVHPYVIDIRGKYLYTTLAKPDADETQFLARIAIGDE